MLSHVLSDNKRRVFDAATRIIESNGQYVVNRPIEARTSGKRNIKMSESSLVSIIPITANATQYVMNITTDQGANVGNSQVLPMEKRLPQQHVFFTSSFGYFLCAFNAGFTGTTPIYPQLHFQLFSYPDPGLGGIGGMADLAAFMGVWATGQMQFEVGGDKVLEDWWLERHMSIPQTQSVFAFTSPNPFWSQQNYCDDGYLPTDPMWIINGGNLNQFIINYGADYNQVWASNPLLNTAAGYQMGIACIWNGWLAQNASSIMNNAPAK